MRKTCEIYILMITDRGTINLHARSSHSTATLALPAQHCQAGLLAYQDSGGHYLINHLAHIYW